MQKKYSSDLTYQFTTKLGKTLTTNSMSINHLLPICYIFSSFFLDKIIIPVPQQSHELFQWNICRLAFDTVPVIVELLKASRLNSAFVYPPVVIKRPQYPIFPFVRNNVLCLVKSLIKNFN